MRPWSFNMDFTKFMNKFNEIEKQLSPTSSLRLSFDNISPESDEPPDINKKLFGVPVPPFVSDKVVSWIEEGLHEPPIFYNGISVIKKLISACGLQLRPHCKNLNYLSRTSSSSISDETYENAINALNKLQSNAITIKKSLMNTNAQSNNIKETAKYLNRIGISLNKLDQLSVIHVSGTKGKGSTCSLTESILRSFNIKTGFFSSPHLISVTERFRINGQPISKEEFTKNFWIVYNSLKLQQNHENDMPAYFKFLTILSFHIFIETKVDVAILEVGIGGENDCTNIVRNTKTVGITSLGLEHTNLLGNTIEEIAWQKAGIIKNNSNCFTVQEQPVEALTILQERAKEKDANLYIVPNYNDYNWYRIPKLKINHEAHLLNISLAIQLAYDWLRRNKFQNLNGFLEKMSSHQTITLDVPVKVIDSLENSFWPGRWQFVNFDNFKIYLDGAHTNESVQICIDWFKKSTHDSENVKLLIFNATGDRDVEKLLKLLNSNVGFYKAYFTPNIPYKKGLRDTSDSRSMIATSEQISKCQSYLKIWKVLNQSNKGEYFTSFENVFKCIDKEFNRNVNVDILITGSIHLIGAAVLALEQFDEIRSNIV